MRNKRSKLLLLTALTATVTLGMSGGTFLADNIDSKTSKAEETIDTEPAKLNYTINQTLDERINEELNIEQIYWEFGDDAIVEGQIAKHTFEEGIHNITATVIYSNEEKEVHPIQIKVSR